MLVSKYRNSNSRTFSWGATKHVCRFHKPQTFFLRPSVLSMMSLSLPLTERYKGSVYREVFPSSFGLSYPFKVWCIVSHVFSFLFPCAPLFFGSVPSCLEVVPDDQEWHEVDTTPVQLLRCEVSQKQWQYLLLYSGCLLLFYKSGQWHFSEELYFHRKESLVTRFLLLYCFQSKSVFLLLARLLVVLCGVNPVQESKLLCPFTG